MDATPNTEESRTGMNFFTYVISIIVILGMGIGGTLFITKPGAVKKQLAEFAEKAQTADSTAKAEKKEAEENFNEWNDADNKRIAQEYRADSLQSLTDSIVKQIAVKDSLLMACSTPTKKAKFSKVTTTKAAVSDSTTSASKVPAGVKPKSKAR